ncbi:hypothetical protein SAMN05878482_106172 [Peribacillus simplex]|uniref:Uncharacterized protein n=1 Tax=Peribacillus simplex TaxID=1478 RepID=A0A9X8WM37_9BACI|nr:hypothetical protein SAMN05878482_106172 [Peribacillus simplex]
MEVFLLKVYNEHPMPWICMYYFIVLIAWARVDFIVTLSKGS